jgi:hypothetical protein
MKLTAPKYLAAMGIVDKDGLAICKNHELQPDASVRGERQGFDRLSILYSLTAETALRGRLCCG